MWCQNSHRIELPYSFQAVAILANDKIPLISKKKNENLQIITLILPNQIKAMILSGKVFKVIPVPFTFYRDSCTLSMWWYSTGTNMITPGIWQTRLQMLQKIEKKFFSENMTEFCNVCVLSIRPITRLQQIDIWHTSIPNNFYCKNVSPENIQVTTKGRNKNSRKLKK